MTHPSSTDILFTAESLLLNTSGSACCKQFGYCAQALQAREAVQAESDISALLASFQHVCRGKYEIEHNPDQHYLLYRIADCSCPIVHQNITKNPMLCNCTRGFMKELFSRLFKRPVEVDIQKTILRGDQNCELKITY